MYLKLLLRENRDRHNSVCWAITAIILITMIIHPISLLETSESLTIINRIIMEEIIAAVMAAMVEDGSRTTATITIPDKERLSPQHQQDL